MELAPALVDKPKQTDVEMASDLKTKDAGRTDLKYIFISNKNMCNYKGHNKLDCNEI